MVLHRNGMGLFIDLMAEGNHGVGEQCPSPTPGSQFSYSLQLTLTFLPEGVCTGGRKAHLSELQSLLCLLTESPP